MNATLARLGRLSPDPLTTGDGPLLAAFLAGDQSAFALLVRRHAGLVFATCRQILRHQEDAEDAFQATFLVLARRAADVWPREAVGSWLFGVARRVALKARAARIRRTGREQPYEEIAGTERPAPDFDLAESVHRVVSKLPEVYRAAVVACDLEGLSRKAAAERLGWSEGTLSGRLARARELLATRLRRVGISLPAGGLAGVCATRETASATAIRTTIELATGTALRASAPVAALTEGVVRGMVLFKFKTLAVALFAACAIGFGALVASGSGAGADEKNRASDPLKPVPATPLKPVEPLAKPRLAPPTKPVTDRDRLQGTWRVVSLTEGSKTTPTNPRDPWVIEVNGSTLRMPYLEGGASTSGTVGSTADPIAGASDKPNTSGSSSSTSSSGWKQREYTFAVDETKTPRTIDLVASKKAVGHGIYEFTAPAKTCVACHANPTGFKPPLPNAIGLCGPGLKKIEMTELGVRLALSIDGKKPTQFGGDSVIVFELKRPDPRDDERALMDEAKKQLERQARLIEARTRVAKLLQEAMAAEEKARLQAEMEVLRLQLDELVVREAERKAVVELRQAQAALERARAQAEVAQANVEQATATMRLAKANVAAAELALANLKKPQPPGGASGTTGAAFTVHVRTLTAAEKVIRVKATGKETVLEGLVYAADDVPIKSDGVSVWLVRDKAVLPVDLPAITKNGDAKTNYTLKAGDQLFVQVKAGK